MCRRNVEVISCGWCGRDLAKKESSYFIDVNGEQNEEICSHCYHRLQMIRNWKETKKKQVSYQGVAFPFEMRMAIEELREVKESEND